MDHFIALSPRRGEKVFFLKFKDINFTDIIAFGRLISRGSFYGKFANHENVDTLTFCNSVMLACSRSTSGQNHPDYRTSISHRLAFIHAKSIQRSSLGEHLRIWDANLIVDLSDEWIFCRRLTLCAQWSSVMSEILLLFNVFTAREKFIHHQVNHMKECTSNRLNVDEHSPASWFRNCFITLPYYKPI